MSTDIQSKGDLQGYGDTHRKLRVRSNADTIVQWPTEPFHHDDVEEWGMLRSFAQDGIVATEPGDDGKTTYQLRSKFRQLAEETIEERDAICPCGHAGVSNQGDHYECAFDGCTETFSREELNA